MNTTPLPFRMILAAVALLLSCAAPVRAEAPKYGLAADNPIYAQQLVNEIAKSDPSIIAVGIHCVAPGAARQSIVASTLNIIGKPSDPEDIVRGSTTISPSSKAPKIGVMMPLHDSARKEIGSFAIQFKYEAGQDQVKFLTAATEIRDRIAKRIPSLEGLFGKGALAAEFDLSGLPPYQPSQPVSGVIRNYGFAFGGLLKVWEAGFIKHHPGVIFQDTLPTSDAAFPALVTGVTDLAPDGGEPAITELLSFYEVHGYHATDIVAASGTYDVEGKSPGIVIYVHPDNPLTRLTLEQLDGIFGTERNGALRGFKWDLKAARGADKDIRTWGQLGLTGEWADKPIHTYGHAPSGTTRFFQLRVLHNSDKWAPSYRGYVETGSKMIDDDDKAEQRGGVQHMLREELMKDRYGIAWTIVPQARQVRGPKPIALATQAGGPYVVPSKASFQDRSYPLVRNLYFYLNRKPGTAIDPKLREFLLYILSREGQEAIVANGNYLPLPADFAAAQRERLR